MPTPSNHERQLDALLECVCLCEIPDGMNARICAAALNDKVVQDNRRMAVFPARARPALAIAAIVALFVTASIVFSPQGSNNPTPSSTLEALRAEHETYQAGLALLDDMEHRAIMDDVIHDLLLI